MNELLNSNSVAALLTTVEEATRSTEEGVKYFVEPADGTLRRAISRRHHMVFGRRGSGKSSLLRKAASDLTVDRVPIASVDLEPFKGHSYPDLLLSVLIATLIAFKKWLDGAAIASAAKTSFWKKLFGKTPSKSAYNKKSCARLSQIIEKHITDLKAQLHAVDAADITLTKSNVAASEFRGDLKTEVVTGPIKAQSGVEHSESQSASQGMEEQFKRSKVDFLKRHIMDYQAVFDELGHIAQADSFLYLDDLYHIRKENQPQVVDYLHSVAKGHHLWLKIGTIRHRTEWYIHGNPPIGVKLGDDAEEIDLDLTLEKYSITKEFLSRILGNLTSSANLQMSELMTDGAIDRLVLASGGVARDFLSIFRRSIDIARERRGEKINAEDINMASGEYDTSKREEFKRDTYTEEEDSLDAIFQNIRGFCLEKVNSNCFLLNKDAKGKRVEQIHELVDLKLIHLIRSRVTVKKTKQGQIFEGYMLDLSQYAGARKRRGLEIVEFWKPDTAEKLRRASLIYDEAGDNKALNDSVGPLRKPFSR
jgi:hypothetical protein